MRGLIAWPIRRGSPVSCMAGGNEADGFGGIEAEGVSLCRRMDGSEGRVPCKCVYE